MYLDNIYNGFSLNVSLELFELPDKIITLGVKAYQ